MIRRRIRLIGIDGFPTERLPTPPLSKLNIMTVRNLKIRVPFEKTHRTRQTVGTKKIIVRTQNDVRRFDRPQGVLKFHEPHRIAGILAI